MNGTEKVVKHLEMIQAVIDRLGRNSFWVKSWSIILIVAAMVLIAKPDMQNSYFVLVLILPALGFWILDGYFLRQERLFRQVYGEIRVQSDTGFEMNPMKHRNKPKCSLALYYIFSHSCYFLPGRDSVYLFRVCNHLFWETGDLNCGVSIFYVSRKYTAAETEFDLGVTHLNVQHLVVRRFIAADNLPNTR